MYLPLDLSGTQIVVLVLIGAVVYAAIHRYRLLRHGKPLPGPIGLPIVGNAFQLGGLPWLKLTEWSKQYGPVYGISLGGQKVLVLNSYKSAHDILDKRSAIYSDRPRLIVISEILCGNLFFAFTRYGDLWRRLRRLTNNGMSAKAAEAYYPYQAREAILLTNSLLQDGESWAQHIKRAISSTILATSYSTPPVTSTTYATRRISEFMHRIEIALTPGSYLVEIFPILNHLPRWCSPWKRYLEYWHEQDSKMFMELYDDVRKRTAAGKCGPCFAKQLMQNPEVTEKEGAWLSGTLFGAGTSTTAATHNVFILAMLLHPHIARKAQAEIDAVIGRDRLPTIHDRPNLPYITAIIREVHRWRNVGPLGVPHYSIEDDVYEGYYVPKGTLVFFNGWAMAFDEDVFDDPQSFRPERYLDETGKKEVVPEYTHGEGHTAFGYGRRKCAGKYIASNTLFINIATMLWALNIESAQDEHGNETVPHPDDFYDQGMVVLPKPFRCRFIPRYPEVLGIIGRRAQDILAESGVDAVESTEGKL